VLVVLRAGHSELLARITLAAARELDLLPGRHAVAVLKTTSVHLLA
jgi:molybdopterin-binding protein